MSEDESQEELRPVKAEDIRTVEAILFAAEEPLDAPNIADKLNATPMSAIMAAIAGRRSGL